MDARVLRELEARQAAEEAEVRALQRALDRARAQLDELVRLRRVEADYQRFIAERDARRPPGGEHE